MSGGEVVRLPTAAKRQVQQPRNKAGRAARLALRKQQGQEFPYKFPGSRVAEKRAAIIAGVDRSPALILAQAILAALDRETRAKVLVELLPSATSTSGRQAFELARSTMLNFGEQMDLLKALAELRGEWR